MKWDLDKVEKVNFTKLQQEVMKLIRKYGSDNAELEKELLELINIIDLERDKNDTIKSLAFDLANKI